MNRLSKLFCGLAALAMVTGCSSEDSPIPGKEEKKGDFFTKLTLQLPSSRSETIEPEENTNSNSGYEVGQDYENHISSIMVVLAAQQDDGTFKTLATSIADSRQFNDPDDRNNLNIRPTYTLTFESEDIIDYAGETIYVFTYCNPTQQLYDRKITENWNPGDGIGDIKYSEDSHIWRKNSFLMTNAHLASITLPTDEEIKTDYSSANTPFFLGTVKVQRAAARFDFEARIGQDGGGATMPGYALNEYPVIDQLADDAVTGKIELMGLSLFNMAKQEYYLLRTSANGMPVGIELCGREIPTNYVVSPNAQWKVDFVAATSNTPEKYYYPINDATGATIAPESFTYTPVSEIMNGTQDKHYGLDNNNPAGGTWHPSEGTDYRIWRYSTENTIPITEPLENDFEPVGKDAQYKQRRGITTGILFKARIKEIGTEEGNQALAAKKVIYAYDGKMYGSKEQLKAWCEKNPSSRAAFLYEKAFVEGNMDANGDLLKSVIPFTDVNGETVDLQTFTIYRPDKNGDYALYYYYYNRHNDNGNNSFMGPMEFAVVRNNVYKIAVDLITGWGHPGNPGDDPDPEDPDDPDEEPKVMLKVNVQVLPWVVRINNITL